MRTLIDNFTRANQSSLGTSPDGITYSVISGSASLDISSNIGEILTTLNTQSIVALNNINVISIKFDVQFKCPSSTFGIAWRINGNNYYYCSLDDSTGIITLGVSINGSKKTLYSSSVLNYVAGGYTRLIIESYKYDIAIYCFPVSADEPSNFIFGYSDNSILQAGSVGYYVLNRSSSKIQLFTATTSYNYLDNQSPLLPPNGWQSSAVATDFCNGSPYDITQIDANAYFASNNSLLRGLLYYLSTSVLADNYIHYHTKLGHAYTVYWKQSYSVAGYYAISLGNPVGSGVLLEVYSSKCAFDGALCSTMMYYTTTDQTYSQSLTPQNLYPGLGATSVASCKAAGTAHAQLSDSVRINDSYLSAEGLSNGKMIFLQEGDFLLLYLNTSVINKLSEFRLDWIERYV